MSSETVHHRRAAAARNEQTILDAATELLEEGKPVAMAAVAAAAGLSRPTVYAHFRDRDVLLEAVVERAVLTARVAIDQSQPEQGDALEALARMAAACWEQIHRHAAVTRAAATELTESTRRKLHAEGLAPLHQLIDRGRRERAFRTDVPATWLVSMFYALLHATADEVLAGHTGRDEAGQLLSATLRELFARR